MGDAEGGVLAPSGSGGEIERLKRCLDIAENLINVGRGEEACAYLRDRVLPAISEHARAAS